MECYSKIESCDDERFHQELKFLSNGWMMKPRKWNSQEHQISVELISKESNIKLLVTAQSVFRLLLLLSYLSARKVVDIGHLQMHDDYVTCTY